MNYQNVLSEVSRFRNMHKGKLVGNNTRLYMDIDSGNIYLKLHNTNIITWRSNGDIILNTNGWTTITTKDRMNKYLSRKSCYVFQKNFVWYVNIDGVTYDYYDGMNINDSKLVLTLAS